MACDESVAVGMWALVQLVMGAAYPAFYQRFGFLPRPGLVLPDVPAEYFQAVSFTGHWPVAQVSYHDAFNATE